MPSQSLRRADLVLDRPGAGQRVGLERRRALEPEQRPAAPVGPVGVARGELHERGERLVQPDAVPPAHRHEVAEPHVGQLVGDDVGDELLLALRRRGRVDEQQVLAERDAAEVLHRPGGEVGQGEQVDLVARVGDAVVVLEPAQGEGADVEAEPGEVALAGDVDDAQRDAVDVDRRRWPRAGRRRRRRGTCSSPSCRRSARRPCRPAARVRSTSGPLDTASSAGSMTSVIAEHGLEVGLVPARERPPAVGGLHLGGGDDVLGAVVVAVRAAVEAAELVVEHAGERDDDGDPAGLEAADGAHDEALGRPARGASARRCRRRGPRGCRARWR